MNAIAPIPAARPVEMQRSTFTAWWITDDSRNAHPEPLFACEDLARIVGSISNGGCFGRTYFILERETIDDAQTLHTYRIRRGKWDGQFDRDTHARTYRYIADHLFSLPVDGFSPTEPFRVQRGGDYVGRDAVIEGVRL